MFLLNPNSMLLNMLLINLEYFIIYIIQYISDKAELGQFQKLRHDMNQPTSTKIITNKFINNSSQLPKQQYKLILFVMTNKHIKNLELSYQNKPFSITHQRHNKLDDGKNPAREQNFWKMFVRLPRTNSYSLKQGEQRPLEFLTKEDQRLIVISSFKNTQTTIDSPAKNFRLHRQKMKRYISDEDFNLIKKITTNHPPTDKRPISSEKQIEEQNQEQYMQNLQKIDSANLPTLQDEQHNQSELGISKRTILSSNFSQIKTKYRVNQTTKKSVISNRITSKMKLPELKEQKKYPVLMKDPEQLKQVKSQSYIIVEYPSERIIVSQKAIVPLEIASLTKIMTFYTIIQIAKDRAIDIQQSKIIVSPKVAHITGTSAELIQGEQYTIEQLLYGLMLPSGNDAANQLAYWGGNLIAQSDDHKTLQKSFIAEMNKNAKILDLKNSKFSNPHGLPHQQARSTATDIAKLCCICMRIDLFRKIVGCRTFKTNVKNGNSSRLVQWQNTNKLLRRQGFIGMKTGITVTAGPCLAAAFTFRNKTYISVVLRAPKVSGRFKQTRLILYWALSKLYKDLNEHEKHILKKLKRHDQQLDSDNSEDEHEFKYDNGGKGEYKKRMNILNYEI